jgi:hypothetical protein
MKSFFHLFYIFGYNGLCFSKTARRFFAKSKIHKAWLSGHMGIYYEGDIRSSITTRLWILNRKKQTTSTFKEFALLALK